MTRSRHVVLTLALVTLLSGAVSAQQDERARSLDQQLERIFKTNEYALPRFGPARWLEDGTAYTSVERAPGPDGGWDIIRYDAVTGARSVLIAGTRLAAPGGKGGRGTHGGDMPGDVPAAASVAAFVSGDVIRTPARGRSGT